MIIIACCVYFSSSGAIIFAHKRIGQHGKEFKCFKFRTMVKNSEEALSKYLKIILMLDENGIEILN